MTKLQEVTPSKSYKVNQVNLFLILNGITSLSAQPHSYTPYPAKEAGCARGIVWMYTTLYLSTPPYHSKPPLYLSPLYPVLPSIPVPERGLIVVLPRSQPCHSLLRGPLPPALSLAHEHTDPFWCSGYDFSG
jgi:hypothetical protein